MDSNVTMVLVTAPLALLCVLLIGLVITHFLALVGIGEGTPWTARASQRFYKGDASPLGCLIAIAWIGGMFYAQMP